MWEQLKPAAPTPATNHDKSTANVNRKRRHSAALEGLSPEKETIWQTLSRITITLILVAGLGVAATFFIPELERRKTLDRDIAALDRQREIARQTRDSLRKTLRWLNDDREYLEIMARDRLDFYVPGESILRIEGPEDTGEAATPGRGPAR